MSLIPLALSRALMITGFVAVIMVLMEYLNVMSQGAWQKRLSRHIIGQYLIAAFLGATPGCLGAFVVVAMYAHHRLTLGSVVAAMIATAGDESFVMFALFPRTALLIHGFLFVVGLASGFLTDLLMGNQMTRSLSCSEDFKLHEQDSCRCLSAKEFLSQWKKCSAARGTLAFALITFLYLTASGRVAPAENWIRVTLVATMVLGLFVVTTVPEHFLEEHLWKHIMLQHVPRIFLWTFGALFLTELLVHQWQIAEAIHNSKIVVLLLACLLGILPESGPHLILVTLYYRNLIPLSTLLANSIVQDGHGMLPMLAHSRRAFFIVKFINLLVALFVGSTMMALGY